MFAAMWQRTFLYRVWQRDKLLFTLFSVFILGQLFFTYKGVENTPFFHYGMYSAPHVPYDSYTVYRIEIDTTPVLSGNFFDAQREIVYNTISEYDGMKQQGFKDSLDKVISHRFSGSTAEKLRSVLLNTAKMDTPYQKWLFSYIADMRMIETPYMSVYKQEVGYTPDGKLIPKQPREALFKLRE
jgi:hypothetical protein